MPCVHSLHRGRNVWRLQATALGDLCRASAADVTCALLAALADALGAPAEGDGAARPRLLLQTHSELLFALPAPAAVSLAATLASHAAGAAAQAAERLGVGVPLPVSVRVGECWASLRPVPPSNPVARAPDDAEPVDGAACAMVTAD
jgi:hypothetical protein